jgi:hypothetical protein
MTYKEIINRFRQVTSEHLMLKDFGYGQLSDLKTQSQLGPEEQGVDYPYLFLLPGTSNRTQSVMNYSFNMIVMDMARGEEGDQYDNYISIQSQCQQYIDDVLARLYYYYKDQPEITLTGITYTPFKEKYQDELAGMTASITIQVPTPLNECITPFQSFLNVVEVSNTVEYTLGPDPGDDKAFTYNNVIYDPENAWNLNTYTSTQQGLYKFVIDQQITLNQPAVGEVIPLQPKLNQIILGQPGILIAATQSSGWPTVFVDTSTVYRYQATYYATVPAPGPAFVWELVYMIDQAGQPESTFQQLIGGNLKISREE